MRPLSAVTLIILGSCFAITFSLTAVIIVVLVLGDEYPRLQSEFDPLLSSLFPYRFLDLRATGYDPYGPDDARVAAAAMIRTWWVANKEKGW
jgi:hypothetical protein